MMMTKPTFTLTALALVVAACCSTPKQPDGAPPEEPAAAVEAPPSPEEPAAAVEAPSPEEPGPMCGGIAAIKCGEGMFCDVAEHCGAGDQSGVCRPIPQFCTRDYRPVCGCNGETYGNACSAHAAGVSVWTKGECQKPE